RTQPLIALFSPQEIARFTASDSRHVGTRVLNVAAGIGQKRVGLQQCSLNRVISEATEMLRMEVAAYAIRVFASLAEELLLTRGLILLSVYDHLRLLLPSSRESNCMVCAHDGREDATATSFRVVIKGYRSGRFRQ